MGSAPPASDDAVNRQIERVRKALIQHVTDVANKLMCERNLPMTAAVISADAMALMAPKVNHSPTLFLPSGPVILYASAGLKRWQVMPIWSSVGDAFNAVGR